MAQLFSVSLSKLGMILLLIAFFFAIVTQRMMLTTPDAPVHTDHISVAGGGFQLPSGGKLPMRNSTLISLAMRRFKSDSTSPHSNTKYDENGGLLSGWYSFKSLVKEKIGDFNFGSANKSLASTGASQSGSHVAPLEVITSGKAQTKAKVAPELPSSKKKATQLAPKDDKANKNNKATAAAASADSSHSSKKKKKPGVTPKNDDSKVQTIRQFHEMRSPRNGSDISLTQQTSLLLCPNQSKCIVPDLFMAKPVNVYFCKHPVRHGVRFYFLVREGLLLHPAVTLVSQDQMHTADYVVYLPGSAPWHLTECANKSLASKLIVLDEFDYHTEFGPYESHEAAVKVYGKDLNWYFMYFKRSYVKRREGKFLRFPHTDKRDLYPITYSIAEAYVPFKFNPHTRGSREIELLCTLRGTMKMSTRMRVSAWVAEYVRDRNHTGLAQRSVIGEVNGASRTTISRGYFEQMYNSRIIVTVNPANWEGDFRLWEALATGALVMVDYLFVPHMFPLVDGKHIVYFDNNNQSDLVAKLDYYRANPEIAGQIAINGYLYAMKHHRTVSMVDYILRSAHVKQMQMQLKAQPEKDSEPLRQQLSSTYAYPYTAQYLHGEAVRQFKKMTQLDRPGDYAYSEDIRTII